MNVHFRQRLWAQRSRFLIAVSALATAGLYWHLAPLQAGPKPEGPVEVWPVQGHPIAGLESVDFSMDPTVDPSDALPHELPRRMLALYNGSYKFASEVQVEGGKLAKTLEPATSENADVARLATLPLNHLGLTVEYMDVNQDPLPSAEAMRPYLGIIIWLEDEKVASPEKLLNWMIREMEQGRKLIFIGDLHWLVDEQGQTPPPELTARALKALGGVFLGTWSEDPTALSVARQDPSMIAFEAAVPTRLTTFSRFRAEPDAQVYLTIAHREGPGAAPTQSDVVWTNPHGGIALAGVAFTEDWIEDRSVIRWIINPFAFFERALGIQDQPRFDFTTLNGTRIFFAHIDGDGLDTITEIDSHTRCGAVIRDEIIKKYNLPFTASAVVGLTAPPPFGKGTIVDRDVARSIFALDNVEVGSHGYAHPLNWRSGDNALLSVDGLPDYKLNGANEIGKSVDYINRELAPQSKPCRIMLWTGACNPTEDQIQWTYRLHLRNINGGDPRKDAFYPSYAHLVAPIHVVGRLFQYFTAGASEYIHTEQWNAPYYRFQNVVQTFEQGGFPKRVIPVNVYFHYYSARNLAGLTGLKRAMDWPNTHVVAPIFASEYVDIVRDFRWARIARDGPDRWTILKGTRLKTIRFDRADVHIDLPHSEGVMGYLNDSNLGVTYVHLTSATRAVIQLSPTDSSSVRLEQATHPVEDLVLGPERFSFVTRGVGARNFVFAGLKPGTSFQVRDNFSPLKSVVTDKNGRLAFSVNQVTPNRISVQVERASQ